MTPTDDEVIQAGTTGRRYRLLSEHVGRLSRPTTKSGQLQRWVLALYLEHREDEALPTAGRFLWYELSQRGLVDKSRSRGHPGVHGRGIDQDVTDAVTQLRKRGFIEWGDIADDSRIVHAYPGHLTLLDGLRDNLDRYRLDPWDGVPPLVLSESRAVAAALTPLGAEYRIAVSGIGGQTHGHLVRAVRPLMVDGQKILYLGDLDLSGSQIHDNVFNVLQRHSLVNAEFHRIGLTEQQANDAGLEPIEKIDKRYRRDPERGRHEAIELEAFGQREIVALVRAELDALLPEPLADVLVREDEERDEIRAILAG